MAALGNVGLAQVFRFAVRAVTYPENVLNQRCSEGLRNYTDMPWVDRHGSEF